MGKQAENGGRYLAKGRQVYLEGSIHSRNYDDKEGNKRYITEIVAQRIQFLGGGNGGGRQNAGGSVGSGVDDFTGPLPDEEVPF